MTFNKFTLDTKHLSTYVFYAFTKIRSLTQVLVAASASWISACVLYPLLSINCLYSSLATRLPPGPRTYSTDSVNLDPIKRDSLQDRQFVTLNIQAEVINVALVYGQKDGFQREARDCHAVVRVS